MKKKIGKLKIYKKKNFLGKKKNFFTSRREMSTILILFETKRMFSGYKYF